MTWKNWPQHINWLNTTLIIFVPMIGLVSSYWVSLRWQTAVFSVLYYVFAGLGIVRFDMPPPLVFFSRPAWTRKGERECARRSDI